MNQIRSLVFLFVLVNAGICSFGYSAPMNLLAAIRAGGDSSNNFFLFADVYSDPNSYESGMLVPLVAQQDSEDDSHHRLVQQEPAFNVLGPDERFVDMTADKNGNIFVLAQKRTEATFSVPLLVCVSVGGDGNFVVERFKMPPSQGGDFMMARALSVNDAGDVVILSDHHMLPVFDRESFTYPLFVHVSSLEKLRENQRQLNKENKQDVGLMTPGAFYHFRVPFRDLRNRPSSFEGHDVHISDQKKISMLIKRSSADGVDSAYVFKISHESLRENSDLTVEISEKKTDQTFENSVKNYNRILDIAGTALELLVDRTQRNIRFLPNQTEVAHVSLSAKGRLVITVLPSIGQYRTQTASYPRLSHSEEDFFLVTRATNGKFFSVGIGRDPETERGEFMIQEFNSGENNSKTYGISAVKIEGNEGSVCADHFLK